VLVAQREIDCHWWQSISLIRIDVIDSSDRFCTLCSATDFM
tara:strand:- start:491 stop:613 length:123 start_codon:yes stop_codon:yes gene_type:complete